MAIEIDATIRVDINKSAKANLIGLINEANGKKFPVDGLEVGLPVSPDDTRPTYTEITVTGIVERGFSGEVEFSYERLNLEELAQLIGPYLEVETDASKATVEEIVQQAFNGLPGEIIINEDFVPEATQVTAQPKNGNANLTYVGSVTFQLGEGIEHLISENYLRGFGLSENGGLPLDQVVALDNLEGFDLVRNIGLHFDNRQLNGFQDTLPLSDVIETDLPAFEHRLPIGTAAPTGPGDLGIQLKLESLIVPDTQGFDLAIPLGQRISKDNTQLKAKVDIARLIETNLDGF